MLDVVEAYVGCDRGLFNVKEVNSRKSKVIVVRKREGGVSWKICEEIVEGGVSWKICEEIVEEVEEFKYLGVWIDTKLRGIVQLEKMVKKGRRVDWKGDTDEQSEWAGGSREEGWCGRKDGMGGRMVWEEGWYGRKDGVGGRMVWEEGWCGRKDGVGGRMVWEEGWCGRKDGVGGRMVW